MNEKGMAKEMTFADIVLEQLLNLRIGRQLPSAVEVLDPYADPIVRGICELFYRRYYSDTNGRRLLVGINPGRFGGGVTGIPFTDPVKLAEQCGIPNNLGRKTELSAEFIYRVIAAYGGVEKFYGDLYVTAVSPLGFTSQGKNLNYYDLPALQEAITPFAVRAMDHTLTATVDRSVCYCIGEGQNFKFLSALNQRHGWFELIIPLAHPRFIMQYRRREVEGYVGRYIEVLRGGKGE